MESHSVISHRIIMSENELSLLIHILGQVSETKLADKYKDIISSFRELNKLQTPKQQREK